MSNIWCDTCDYPIGDYYKQECSCGNCYDHCTLENYKYKNIEYTKHKYGNWFRFECQAIIWDWSTSNKERHCFKSTYSYNDKSMKMHISKSHAKIEDKKNNE